MSVCILNTYTIYEAISSGLNCYFSLFRHVTTESQDGEESVWQQAPQPHQQRSSPETVRAVGYRVAPDIMVSIYQSYIFS